MATRKLAAILAADVVGYSRLAGSDEERTYSRIHDARPRLFRTCQKRLASNCLGARQLALSCDPIVLFEGVPDLVLTFTILCSGQSSCDQVRSWYHIELRPHLGVNRSWPILNLCSVTRHLAICICWRAPERPPKCQTAIARQHPSEVVDCLPQVRRQGGTE